MKDGREGEGRQAHEQVTTKSLLRKHLGMIWGSQWERYHFNQPLPLQEQISICIAALGLANGTSLDRIAANKAGYVVLLSVFIPGTTPEEMQFMLAKQRVKFWIAKVAALLTKEKHRNREIQALSTSGTFPSFSVVLKHFSASEISRDQIRTSPRWYFSGGFHPLVTIIWDRSFKISFRTVKSDWAPM